MIARSRSSGSDAGVEILRPDLSLFSLDDDFVVFSEHAQRLGVLNHSAGMIVRSLTAGATPADAAMELVSKGFVSPDQAHVWVSGTIETLNEIGLTAAAGRSEQAGSTRDGNFAERPDASPRLPDYEVVAERSYRLLGTRALVRFGLHAQVAWIEAALEHLGSDDGEPPNVIFDIPGEELPDERRFGSVYRDGQCLQANVRLSCIAPIVKSGLWQSAVNAHDFLFNFHAGVVGHEGSCILLPAAAGSGKSSLSAALTHSGFEYFSDEVALIEPGSFHVPRVPLALCVKSSGWNVIAEYYPRILHLPTHTRADGKRVRYLRSIAGNAARQPGSAPVSHIIFPKYNEYAGTEIQPLRRAQALERLMSECVALRRRLTRKDAEGLAHWMETIDCSALTFSSLRDAVDLVRRVVLG